jgi:hypothetical protein
MAKRRKRRPREKAATVEYVDGEGNRLLLRESLSRGTIRKIGEGPATAAATQQWVRETIARHLERYIPELAPPA